MKKILFPLLLATVALLSCQKEPDKVETDPAVVTPAPGAVEPAALFVEGLASADASDPSTRSWIYTNDADGAEVLKFCWAENAYATDGSARFEGYWVDSYGRFDDAWGNLHTILNSSQHATYVATVDGNTNIHVALPAEARSATKLIVLYSGNNVNHTYWFENPSQAQVSLSENRREITFTFDGINKRSFYAPNLDNNEAIYGVATLTEDAITEEGNQAATSVDFNFKHLESVFRVRIKNEYDSSINLDRIIIQAKPRKNNPGTKPFANKLCLTYKDGSFTRSLFEDPDTGQYLDSDWFATEPVLTIPETDNDPYEHMSIPSGGVETVYLMPLANPDCNLNNWVFTFKVEAFKGGNKIENSVYVNGSAIASGSGKSALQPGYVYTVGLKAKDPNEDDYPVGEEQWRFRRSGHDLTLLRPVNGQYSGDFVIPSEITIEGETFHIRKIGKWAFAMQPVTSVVFPDYVEFEDTEALFFCCSGLSSVTLPAWGLTTIGGGVTGVIGGMFAGCSSLESLTIPASVTHIEPQAFSGCSQLGGHIVSQSSSIIVNESGLVYTPSGELYWVPENLSGAVSIPDGITRIMYSAISAPPSQNGFPPSQISEMEIPASVSRIDGANFINLLNLQKLTVNWTDRDSMPAWYRSNGQIVSNEDVISSGQWFAGMDLSAIELSVPIAYDYLYQDTEPWKSFNVTTRQ